MDFLLTDWKTEYISDIAKYANNKKIADNLRDGFPHPYTYEDARNYIAMCIENTGKSQLCQAIVAEGHGVGSVGVFVKDDVYRKSAELGYWLAEPYWGKGIMSRAVRQICDQAFARFDIVRIFAEPYAYNNGSIKVLEKAGFTLEGVMKQSVYKNGQIFDACMYAKLKER